MTKTCWYYWRICLIYWYQIKGRGGKETLKMLQTSILYMHNGNYLHHIAESPAYHLQTVSDLLTKSYTEKPVSEWKILKNFLEGKKSGEWAISRKMKKNNNNRNKLAALQRKEKTERAAGVDRKKKGGGRKGESNDNPEFPDRRGIWDIPRLPSGVSVAKASHIRARTHTHTHTHLTHSLCDSNVETQTLTKKIYFLLQRQIELLWHIQTSTFNNMCVLLKLLISVYVCTLLLLKHCP